MEKRVLVADDEEIVRDLLVATLERGGYAVEGVPDGRAALERAGSFHPDLMVLDVIMPAENGYRVSRMVKAGEAPLDPTPKILLLTGRRLDDDPDRESLFMSFSMADAILYKPFEIRDLLATVEQLIGRP